MVDTALEGTQCELPALRWALGAWCPAGWDAACMHAHAWMDVALLRMLAGCANLAR